MNLPKLSAYSFATVPCSLRLGRYRADLSCKKAECHSTWGKGKNYPNPAGNTTMDDGVVVPAAKVRLSTAAQPSHANPR